MYLSGKSEDRNCLLPNFLALGVSDSAFAFVAFATGNRSPKATWYTEGLAEYFGMHNWDGKTLTGVVNPGFDQLALQNAKLNPKDWTLHFEVDRKESSGSTVHCMVDGKIDKLGSDRRTLTGTFNCGTTKGDFKLTRDRDY